MGKTQNHKLNYPEPDYPPDVPKDMKLLAEDAERELDALKATTTTLTATDADLSGRLNTANNTVSTIRDMVNSHINNHPAPAKAVTAKYHYSGKPAGTLSVGSTYKEFDGGRWKAPFSGVAIFLWYANCGTPGGSRKLRARIDRDKFGTEPADATAYHDYFYSTSPGGTWMVNNMYFLDVQETRTYSLHWSCQGGTVNLSTRYLKVFLLSLPATSSLSSIDQNLIASFLGKSDLGADSAPGTAVDMDGNSVAIPTVDPADYRLINGANALPDAGGFSFSI